MNKNSLHIVLTILLSLSVVLFSVPATASYSDRFGDYSVNVIENTGTDWNEDGVGDFYIYYPAEMADGHHPIIVFCVGTGAHPETSYGDYLREYSSHGFVIIAGTDENQRNGEQADCGLSFIIGENSNPDSIFYNKLDVDNIMSMGHSQGGNACLHVAINDSRVTAVLSLMPGKGRLHGTTVADATRLAVPVFYVTASLDYVVWPIYVKLIYYNKTKNADAWLGKTKLTGHCTCNEGIDYTLRVWMYAKLYHDPEAESLLHFSDLDEYQQLDPDFQWRYIKRNFDE